MKPTKKPTQKPIPEKQPAKNSFVTFYLAIIFSFFPLFLTDQYGSARLDKYFFFLFASGVFLISTGLCMYLSYSNEKSAGNTAALITPLSLTDVFMLCFLGFALFSTLITEHPGEAILGPNPLFVGTFHCRNNGLVLLLVYTLVYFIITRNYTEKGNAFTVYLVLLIAAIVILFVLLLFNCTFEMLVMYVVLMALFTLMYVIFTHYNIQREFIFVIFLITASAIALLTVLNFFYIDPLRMLEGYDEATIADFGSTLGNKNIIAAFMCVFLPVAVMLFVVTKITVVRIVAGISIVFAYTGLLCADSTSDILGLIVILPVMAIFCARSFTYLRRYLLALTILFASGKALWIFALIIGDHNKGFEFMQEFLIYDRLMFLPIAVCCLLYLLMMIFEKKIEAHYPAKALTIVFASLFSIGIITALFLFIRFSFFDRETDIGNFEKLLRFDDYWGTHRGFMWRVSFEEFAKFKPLQFLFGTGPDTAYYVLQPHFGELSSRFGDTSTDCAHNEFINYLLTQGVLGLAAYLGVMICAIVRAIKTAKANPMVLVFISPVICYLAQSTVNLYNPIVTPYLFIFLALTEALNRKEQFRAKHEERESMS